MADLGKLPEYVMREILSRLPLESLLRFKCVSKLWYAVIHDPRSVLLMRLVENKGIWLNEIRFSFLKYDPLAADDNHTPLGVEDVEFPSFVSEESPHISICGHSHGLVCLARGGSPEHAYLYNPTTGHLRKLPPSILLFDDYDSIERDLVSIENAIGFGYDPKSKDFKVVRTVDFSLIPVPESFEKDNGYLRSLGVLSGSIIFFYYPLYAKETSFELWEMLKTSGGVVSWSKLFTISPGFYINCPLAFVSSNELLMEMNHDKLILYNIKTQQFKYVSFETKAICLRATVFVKTLLSVNAILEN